MARVPRCTDRSRPKSFRKALNGLKLLQGAGFPVAVRVTINRFNVDDIENVTHLLLDEVGLPSFGTNEAFPCGATDRNGEITLSFDQRQKASNILQQLSKKYHGRIDASAGPLAYARQCELIQMKMASGETSIPGRGNLSSCGGVFSKISILHDGTIVPCHNLSLLDMGKIGEQDFQYLWQHNEVINTVRRRSWIPLNTIETCRDCAYIGFCTGGCPAGAVYSIGDLNSRNPMDCYRIHRGEDPYVPA